MPIIFEKSCFCCFVSAIAKGNSKHHLITGEPRVREKGHRRSRLAVIASCCGEAMVTDTRRMLGDGLRYVGDGNSGVSVLCQAGVWLQRTTFLRAVAGDEASLDVATTDEKQRRYCCLRLAGGRRLECGRLERRRRWSFSRQAKSRWRCCILGREESLLSARDCTLPCRRPEIGFLLDLAVAC